jgi:hypothetical protein
LLCPNEAKELVEPNWPNNFPTTVMDEAVDGFVFNTKEVGLTSEQAKTYSNSN